MSFHTYSHSVFSSLPTWHVDKAYSVTICICPVESEHIVMLKFNLLDFPNHSCIANYTTFRVTTPAILKCKTTLILYILSINLLIVVNC